MLSLSKLRAICVLTFLLPMLVFSQENKLTGKITSKSQEQLENVVIILEEYQGHVIAFGNSDDMGKYSIEYNTEQDSISIKFRRLGLETIARKIPVSVRELNVVMGLAAKNTLEEVVVRNRRPIESKGDTIAYNPRYFKDGTERNVEDLLAKLPGISVDATSGTIKYQGREIKKILLDGDDLTGSNYKVLSKNLSADWLEEVEVVKKFNNKRLLRGIKQSNDIAINLKLNENAKAPIFGKADIGAGIKSKYALKAELLSYLKKMKLFSTAETNNIGTDLETYDLETYLDNQQGGKGFINPTNILDNDLASPNFFKQENFTFHHGVFVSTAALFKPNGKLKIRSLTNFYDNNLSFLTSDSLAYFLPDGRTLSINEFQNQTQRPREVFQDIKIEYAIKENQDLNIRFQYKNVLSKTNAINQTALINATQFDALEQNRLLATATYTKKLNANWAGEIELKLGNENLNENLEVLYPDGALQNIDQSFLWGSFNMGGDVNLYGKIFQGTFVNFYSGWNKSVLELKPLLSTQYELSNLYSELEVRKELNKFTINGTARLRRVNLEFDKSREKKSLFETLLGISYKAQVLNNIELKVKTLFSSENNFIQPNQLFSQSVFVDYRSVFSYQADFSLPQKSNLFLTSVKISENAKTYLTSNIEIGLESLSNGLVPYLSFQDEVVSTQFVQSENVESIFTNFGVDKYFSKLKTNLGLAYSSQLSKSFLSVNGQFGQSRLLTQQWKLNTGIVLSRKLNVSLSASINSNFNEWSGEENTFSFNKYFTKFVYKPIQRFRFVGEIQILDFGQELGGVSSLSNFFMLYKPDNDKWSFDIRLNNIFDMRNVGIGNNSPSIFSQTNYAVQPRFFIASVTRRF